MYPARSLYPASFRWANPSRLLSKGADISCTNNNSKISFKELKWRLLLLLDFLLQSITTHNYSSFQWSIKLPFNHNKMFKLAFHVLQQIVSPQLNNKKHTNEILLNKSFSHKHYFIINLFININIQYVYAPWYLL